MRELLISYITYRFKHRGFNEVNYHGLESWGLPGGYKTTDKNTWDEQIKTYEDLQSGVISIEEYLQNLNDFQLIKVFESQCCQDFR